MLSPSHLSRFPFTAAVSRNSPRSSSTIRESSKTRRKKNFFSLLIARNFFVSAFSTLCSYVTTCDDIVKSISRKRTKKNKKNFDQRFGVKFEIIAKETRKNLEKLPNKVCLSTSWSFPFLFHHSILICTFRKQKANGRENIKIKTVNKFHEPIKWKRNKDVWCVLWSFFVFEAKRKEK